MHADSLTTTPAPNPPSRKPRNRVEMLVVRGSILLLLLLVAVQAHARFGYEWSLQKLQSHIAKEEESAVPLLLSDVPKHIIGFPSRQVNEDRHWRQIVYKWQGLTRSYEIRLPYDETEAGNPILSLVTAEPPQPKAEAEYPKSAGNDAEGTTGGLSRPSRPEVGGPGRPDLMASDADGDGRISKAEAPERMAPFFDRMDTNTDGYIDMAEITEASLRRAERQRNAEEQPGAEGNPPQRPATETDKPAEVKDADKPLDAVPDKETEKPADAAGATPSAAT